MQDNLFEELKKRLQRYKQQKKELIQQHNNLQLQLSKLDGKIEETTDLLESQ